MNKKRSHKLTITNAVNGKVTTISKKNISSFEEQTKTFINLILNSNNKDFFDFKDGENSLKYYEKVWKNFQNRIFK